MDVCVCVSVYVINSICIYLGLKSKIIQSPTKHFIENKYKKNDLTEAMWTILNSSKSSDISNAMGFLSRKLKTISQWPKKREIYLWLYLVNVINYFENYAIQCNVGHQSFLLYLIVILSKIQTQTLIGNMLIYSIELDELLSENTKLFFS